MGPCTKEGAKMRALLLAICPHTSFPSLQNKNKPLFMRCEANQETEAKRANKRGHLAQSTNCYWCQSLGPGGCCWRAPHVVGDEGTHPQSTVQGKKCCRQKAIVHKCIFHLTSRLKGGSVFLHLYILQDLCWNREITIRDPHLQGTEWQIQTG